jgi:signal transduction histidine kinase
VESKRRRFRVVADLKLQGSLCLRVAIYWIICQCAFVATILGFSGLEAMGEPTEVVQTPWRFLIPAIVVSSFLLPVVLLDLLVFSNRFAGPLVRFRRYLKQLAGGKIPDHELRFRHKDELGDLSVNINKLQERLIQIETVQTQTAKERDFQDDIQPTQPELQLNH